MNHLLNVLDGIASVFDWAAENRPYTTTRGGFARDQKRLRGDATKVGNDMRKAIKKYGGEPSGKRAG